MSRLAYLVELTANNITYLAWAAGLAEGSGNKDASAALQDILSRIEAYEVPDDVTEETLEFLSTPDDELPALELVEDEADAEATLDGTDNTGEREPDPNFPGPGLWTPPPPVNHPSDFGAGPPPAGGPR